MIKAETMPSTNSEPAENTTPYLTTDLAEARADLLRSTDRLIELFSWMKWILIFITIFSPISIYMLNSNAQETIANAFLFSKPAGLAASVLVATELTVRHREQLRRHVIIRLLQVVFVMFVVYLITMAS